MEKFEGFDPEPKTWDFPMIINGWVHRLTGTEFKVLWYILRHTYGWQKTSDTISYKQFRFGIRKKDGTWLDRGTGSGVSSLKRAIKGLVEKGFIEVIQEKDDKGRWKPAKYKLKYRVSVQKQPTDERPTDNGQTIQSLTNIQSLNNKQQYAEQSSAGSGKEINELIEKFKPINPSYERLFSNKTQRAALERMLKKLGRQKLEQVLDILPAIFGKAYAPRITTPYALEQKLADLFAFLKERSEIGGKVFTIKSIKK